MQENTKLIVTLLERATEYGKISFDLVKLKTLDKISDIVSSFIPHTVVFVIIATFLVFLNLGIAFWLGEILGMTYLGFFVVAAFYFIIGLFFHFFLHNRIKKIICDYIIKNFLK